MSKYGLYYLMQIKNAEMHANGSNNNQTVYVRIFDRSLLIDDSQSETIIQITGAGDPLHTSTVDNAEDKFTGIKATQATIKFISDGIVGLSTFVDSPIPTGGTEVGDPRYSVEVSVNSFSNIVFKGFINVADCTELFMPDGNVVTLIANDGLAGLRNKPLLKPDGKNPTGYNRIADYLAWALKETGLNLNLNAVFNIRHKDHSTSHFFDIIELHAKTFEDQIGTCISCYDAIDKILGEMAILTQRSGEWWIISVDEINQAPYYVALFDSDGEFVSLDTTGINYDKQIQKESDIYFSNEATNVGCSRPYKYIKETFNFSYPLEIIDNIDFSRGDLYLPLDMSPVVISGTTFYVKKYHVADWTLLRGLPGTPVTNDSIAYIRRLFKDVNLTYEAERQVFIEPPSAANVRTPYIESHPVPIDFKDKFVISADFKFPSNITTGSTGNYPILVVRLQGVDGSHWWLGHEIVTGDFTNPKWYQSNFDWSAFSGLPGPEVPLSFNGTIDTSQEQTCSWDAPPCPVAGDLYVQLHGFNYVSGQTWDNVSIIYSNLQFQYIPLINGDYSKYSGEYQKIYRTIDFTEVRDKDVYVSEAPKQLFKGAFFISNGTGGHTLLQGDNFYAGQAFPTGTPTGDFIHPYSEIQAFCVWNQYRNPMRKFELQAQGLHTGDVDTNGKVNTPHLIHRYTIADTSEHTNGKYFMLLTFDCDWRLCEWNGTLVEVYDTDRGRRYDDNRETKYIQ